MSSPFKPEQLISFDWESWALVPGNLTPPPVVASAARVEHGTERLLHPPSEAARFLAEVLRQPGSVVVTANGSFDDALSMQHFPELVPLIFAAYERGDVFDVQIAQALDAVAKGCLFKDPLTGKPLKSKSGKRARYSLATVVEQVLGRQDAKANDTYRLRYGELAGIPLEQWPEVARRYPLDDARNTVESAAVQLRAHENLGPIGSEVGRLALKEEGLTHLTLNLRAALALHLGSVWGLRTEKRAIEQVLARVAAHREEALERLVEAGLISINEKTGEPKKNTSAIKRRVAEAFGCSGPCGGCSGGGKVPSAKTGKPVVCGACDGTGLDIESSPALLRTAGGGVATERELVLMESDDELLELLADHGSDAKIDSTYAPALLDGASAPLNIRSNVLVETARTSYEGIAQTMPRKGGVRECIVARRREFLPDLPEGWEDRLLCSTDFAAVELSTLGQVCLWVVGESELANAINSGKDPHALFAADLMALDYDDVKAGIAAGNEILKDARQMSKAANFGFPGLMGAQKFVQTKRKEGLWLCVASRRAPVCDACGGLVGSPCRRCRGRGGLCGVEKTFKYKGRPVPPTCMACLEVAEELRKTYLSRWPEVPEYWKWVQQHEGVSYGDGRIVSPGTGYVRKGVTASSGANHCFQHLAAYAAKHAAWKLTRESYTIRRSPLWNSKLLMFVHDETIMEHRESVAHEAAWRQSEIMVEAAREFVPDVRISAEPALMRRLYKAAELVKDGNGRLIPWEPRAKQKARALSYYKQAA